MSLPGSAGAKTVSFSGVDGAGKSTQIEGLRRSLEERGLRVRTIRFWDDVASLRRLREEAGHKVFRGEKGIGTPEAPVNRRDKNVRGWPMTCLRLVLYFLDALSLRKVFRRATQGNAELIIFDRYLYDELANLNLNRRTMRIYARFLARLVPRTNISLVLDADPEGARARKPEYPLDFLRFNREAYLRLSRLFALIVIPPLRIEDAHREIVARTLEALAPNSGRDAIAQAPESSEVDAPRARPAVF